MLKPFTIIAFSSTKVVLVLVAVPKKLNSNANKIRIQILASQVLNREVRIHGPLGISLRRELHFTLHDKCLSDGELKLIAAKQTKIEVAVLALLVRNVGIQSIDLSEPSISIVHNSVAAACSEKPQAALAGLRYI